MGEILAWNDYFENSSVIKRRSEKSYITFSMGINKKHLFEKTKELKILLFLRFLKKYAERFFTNNSKALVARATLYFRNRRSDRYLQKVSYWNICYRSCFSSYWQKFIFYENFTTIPMEKFEKKNHFFNIKFFSHKCFNRVIWSIKNKLWPWKTFKVIQFGHFWHFFF